MRKLVYVLSFFFPTLHAQTPLVLNVEFLELTATEKIYNFAVDDFTDFIGWQFQMDFDGAKMTFKEVRNSVHPTLSSSNFNEPIPGELRSVWVDHDLESNDFPDSTVLFQLVFDLLDPNGSSLCFHESQEYFQFILDDDHDYMLAEIIISDDCNDGLSIFLNTTTTRDLSISSRDLIEDVYLSTTGLLSFSSPKDHIISLRLLDLNGKTITLFPETLYTKGRHTMVGTSVASGLYILNAIAEDGSAVAIKVFAE